MAETTDRTAHYRSIDIRPNSLPMLNGQRYSLNFLRNQDYQIPADKFNELMESFDPESNADEFIKLAQWYVNDHYTWQVPRILNLERYYLGDSNIHYWASDKKKRADNRIAGGLPRYITDFGIGYQFGNDIKFSYENKDNPDDDGEDLLQQITDFNNICDEPYHEKNMGKNIWNTGRAYELLYVPESTITPKMMFIDPSQAFVVYDTSIDKNPLFAVRYYVVNYMNITTYQVELYTDTNIYYFSTGEDPHTSWQFKESTEHYFGEVPINEIDANEERVGKWEPHLDKIDARDKALSEMANSQEDFSNATLVISGNIEDTKIEHLKDNEGNFLYYDSITGVYTTDEYNMDFTNVDEDDPDSQPDKVKNRPVLVDHNHDLKANMMVLKPSQNFNPDGSVTMQPTDAKYLTKDLNAAEWETYINKLTSDIHKETNTPDMSDDNFVGNASGVAMAYKLMGSDQERVITETLYKRGIMRRLRLLCNYWKNPSSSKVTFADGNNPADNVTVKFTPNLPKNEAEIISNITSLYDTGEISSQTFLEEASQFTGVSADVEMERKQAEDEQNANANAARIQQAYKQYTGESGGTEDSTSDGNDPDENNQDGSQTTEDGGDD